MKSTIALVIALVIFVLAYLGWSRIPDIFANHLSQKLGAPVHVGDIDLSLKQLKVEKSEIGNPPKYTTLPRAFSCEETLLKAPLTQYLKTDIVIEEIVLNNIYLGLEFDSASGTKGNWSTLMGNYQQSMAQATSNGKTSKKRTIFIKTLYLRNITTDLIFLKDGSRIRRLPTIREIKLTNISSEGQFPVDQLTRSILGEMLKSVFMEQNLENMLKGIFQTPDKALDTIISPFKDLFNARPKHTADPLCLLSPHFTKHHFG